MNPREQRARRTAVETLANETADVFKMYTAELTRLEAAVNSERTHRLKLAEEQRGYVDARDRELRDRCDDRWVRANMRADAFEQRGFWSRLNWLLTGR